MSLIDDLLIVLTNYSQGYKLMSRRMHGYTGPADFPYLKKCVDAKENTLRITLSRLKKRNLVKKQDNKWTATAAGQKFIAERVEKLLKYRYLQGTHSSPDQHMREKEKSMIVSFDVPEIYRKKRDWLRAEITMLGFTPLQKSVWFGPAPLPEKFINAISELGLLPYVKFFKAKEDDIV